MKRVLLVNDCKFENLVMKDMLNSMNYEVYITEEYNAISAVHDFCPNYVITNYIMKEIKGDMLAAIIKIQYPDIKCIISSSSHIDIMHFDCKKVDAVILTPIDREALKMVLNSITSDVVKKNEDIDNYEVKKYCSKCQKFVDLNIDTEYFFCPFCGQKI